MAKLSPRFVTYFIFALLALAFIFPLTHSAYEGLANKDEENSDVEDEDEEEVMEGVDGPGSQKKNQKGKRGSFIDDVKAQAAKMGLGKVGAGSSVGPKAKKAVKK
jgi:hypothetical protein